MAEALFHFDVGRVQPSKGDRLVKVAAYDAATVMVDDNGEAYDFRRKRKNDEYQTGFVVAAALDAAPELVADRERLWKAALAAETRRDGNSAILLEILIPDVIEYSEREDFARHVLARWIVDGAVAQVDLHQPLRSDGSGLRQPHAHAILSRRALGPEGFYGPKLGDEPFQKKNLKQTRSRVAADMNEWLARHGYDVRVDSRSNTARGIDIAPERNVDPRAVQVVRHAPDEAYVWPQVLKRRDDRRALRRARAEAAEAETDFQTLMQEYDDARREAADHNADTFSGRSTPDGDARRDPRDPRGYSSDHRSAGGQRHRRRAGPDRPDSGSASRGADEPRGTARQGRPARNRHAESVALGSGRRVGDNRLDEARARLRQADGRAEKARRRMRERAAFDGPRPALDDRVTEARHRLRDAGPPGVGPVAPHDRAARRRRHLAALLSEAYDTGWLPESVVGNIAHISFDRIAGIVTVVLRDGAVLRDDGFRVHLDGRPSTVATAELLAAAERHGWLYGKDAGIEVSGSMDFRRAVALELLARHPPVRVDGLDERDRRFVFDELTRRERQRRVDAIAALKLAEADVGKAPQIRSTRPGDPRALVAIRDAQAAVADGDERTIDAASRGAISDAVQAAAAWRSRQGAASEASERIDVAPGPDRARGCVPPWATGPRRRKSDGDGGRSRG
ncbi:MAG TPA: MobA/MobL family protein [Rhizomicrobium sp.]|nr:MobA/MobL family protein [Rhizomicrobium sp.]